MSWWSRITGGKSGSPAKSQRMDYLSEALTLERQGDFAAALTSYRLALRDKPDDHRVLQNMAIAYSKTGQLEDAIRCYRRALDLQPTLAGAHYGIAFLLLKKGDSTSAEKHLDSFLAAPPQGPEGERWIRHARTTLARLRGEGEGASEGIVDAVDGVPEADVTDAPRADER